MTLTQLSYIVAVETHGHFGRAAEACGVTQPALSMQVRKLERELGVVLFDRTRSPVIPTDLGRLIVEQARVVLRETARIPELKEEAGGKVAGELRVGVIPTLGPYLLPRFVQRLAQEHPGLQLVLEEMLTATIVERLRSEKLDIGLIASDEGPDLLYRPLFEEPFVAYVSREHPLASRRRLSPHELSRDDFWVLSEAHCMRSQVLELCGGSSAPDHCARGVRMESGNLETLRRLVERGGGYTLLPVLAVEGAGAAPEGVRVVEFEAPAPRRQVVMARRRTYLKRRLVEVFLEALLESLPGVVTAIPPRAAAG